LSARDLDGTHHYDGVSVVYRGLSSNRSSEESKRIEGFYSLFLACRVSHQCTYYSDSYCRTRLSTSRLLRPAQLRSDFRRVFASASNSALLSALEGHVRYTGMVRRGKGLKAPAPMSNLPESVVGALRLGEIRCSVEDPPSVKKFSPMALLTVYNSSASTSPSITIPPDGLKFEAATALGELYVCILQFITSGGHDAELCLAVRGLLDRMYLHFDRRTQTKLEETWNSTREHRVYFTFLFLQLLNDLTHDHALVCEQAQGKRGRYKHAYIQARRGRTDRVDLVRTAYEPAFCPVHTNPGTTVTVTDATTQHINDFFNQLQHGAAPTMSAVPSSLYPSNAAGAARQPNARGTDSAGDNKGKQDTKKASSKSITVAELFKSKDGQRVKLKEQVLFHNNKKAPTIKIGDVTKSLCVRSCGTTLGGCNKGKKCNNYHFDPQLTKAPDGVDVSDARKFFLIPAIKEVLEPTALGKTVFEL